MSLRGNKKLFLWSLGAVLLLIGFLSVFNFALAQAETNFGLDNLNTSLGRTNLLDIIANIINVILGVIGIVLLLLIFYAGWLWMTAAGDPGKIEKAKQIIISAVIGLVIVLSSFAIAYFVIRTLSGATGGGGGLEPCSPPGSTGTCGPNGCGTRTCQSSGYWGACDTATPACGLVNSCVITKILPKDYVPLRNVVVRAFLNHDPGSAINPTDFKVTRDGATLGNDQACTTNDNCLSDNCDPNTQKCVGDLVAGTVNGQTSILTFTPSAPCPAPNADRFCFSEDATYNISLTGATINCGGYNLDCSLSPSGCVGQFTTGSLVDIQSPTVRVQPGPICKPDAAWSGTNTIRAQAQDDAGVAYVDFFADNQAIGTDTNNSTNPFDAQITWNASGANVGDRVAIKAKAFDQDSNSAENTKNFTIRPGHCCNGVQDSAQGEEGIDCGGNPQALGVNYCGACAGADCDIDNNTPACQPDDDICHYDCWDQAGPESCKCVEPPIISYLSPARDVAGNTNMSNPATWADDVPNGAVNNFVTIWGKSFGQIASLLENTLTFVDFEGGTLGGMPTDWGKWMRWGGVYTYLNQVSIGLSNEQGFSGTQSIKIYRNPNNPPNGWSPTQLRCSQALCNGDAPYEFYPFKRGGVYGGCQWVNVGGVNKCDLPDRPTACGACQADEGNLVPWPFQYINNWVTFYYNISNLDFNLGDRYVLRFKYKGTLDSSARVRISYGIDDWLSQSWQKVTATYSDPNCTLNGGAYCSNNPGRCQCSDPAYAGYCCLNSPVQTKPFTVYNLSEIPSGNYADWQDYEAIFTYNSNIDALRDRNNSPHRMLTFVITDSQSGPNGSNFYLDDFVFAKLPNQGEVRMCGGDIDADGDACDNDGDDRLAKFPSELNDKCSSTWVDNQIIVSVPGAATSGSVRVKNEYGYYDVTNNNLGPLINDFEVNSIVRPSICLMDPDHGADPNATGGTDTTEVHGINFPLPPLVQNLVWYLREWNSNNGSWTFANVTSSPNAVTQGNWGGLKIKENVPANKTGWADVAVYNGSEFSNHYMFLLSSGNVGDPCGWSLGGVCSPNASICQPGLICDTTSCTCQVSSTCNNNNIIDAGEECDGTNLGGVTCQSLGFISGSVSCSDCRLIKNCSHGESWGAATQSLYAWAFSTTNFAPLVETTCGNGQLDYPEECDGQLFRVSRQCGQADCQASCNSECKIDCSACTGKWPAYSATQAVYAWSFVFGRPEPFPELYVVEECNRDPNCQTGARLASPTPWSDGWTTATPGVTNPLACVNAEISARFNVGVNVFSLCNGSYTETSPGVFECDNTLNNRVKLLKCDDPEGTNCQNVPLAFTLKIKSDNNDQRKNDYFIIEPNPGISLAPNSWYKVILLKGISSLAGEVIRDDTATGGRAVDRHCNVAGITNAAYCWNFQTRPAADPDLKCPAGCPECSPDQHTFFFYNETQTFSSNLDSADNVCLVLNPSDYNWDWYSDKADKVSITNQDVNPNDGKIDPEQIGTALKETIKDNPNPYAQIFAKLTETGKEDSCQATVDFTNPYVIEDPACKNNIQSPTPWINSQDACVNAMIAARFSRNMINSRINTNNVRVEKCNSGGEFNEPDCNEITGAYVDQIKVFRYTPDVFSANPGLTREEIIIILEGLSQGGLPEGFWIIPKTNQDFEPNTWYRVVILGGEGGVRGANNEADSSPEGILQTGNSINEEVKMGWSYGAASQNDYYWIFKTGSQRCKINSVAVSPFMKFMRYTDEKEDYNAWPFAENCNLLNPYGYDWNWRSLIRLEDDVDENDATGGSGTSVATVCDAGAASCATSNVGLTAPEAKVFARQEGDTNIKARAKNTRGSGCGAWNDPACGDKWGFGQLFIGYNNLRVTKKFPSCDSSGDDPNYVSQGICMNALLGAEFSLDVRSTTFNASNIKLYKVNGANLIPESIAFVYPISNVPEFSSRLGFRRSGGLLLEANTTYRVVIKDGADGLIAWNGKPLTNLNYNDGGHSGEECDPAAYPFRPADKYHGDCDGSCLLVGNLCNTEIAQCENKITGSIDDFCMDNCRNAGNTNSASCGDGIKKSGVEECDDGNTTDTDGCSKNCKLEGSDQRYGSLCGNGKVETGEDCDDSNTSSGDGCSNKCLMENGYSCTGQPSVCVVAAGQTNRLTGSQPNVPVCGNGKKEIGESCDDGNTNQNDGCSNHCLSEGSGPGGAVCGDGKIENGHNNSYSWMFKTLDKPCEVGKVQLFPAEVTINSVGDLPQPFWPDPRSAADACNKDGQSLSPICYRWAWTVEPDPWDLYYTLRNENFLPSVDIRNGIVCPDGTHPWAWGARYTALDAITDGLTEQAVVEISGGKSCLDTNTCSTIKVVCSFCNSDGQRDLDSVCNDLNNKGVGSDCCCHYRPVATSVSPANICTNEVIDIKFTDPSGDPITMDVGSLTTTTDSTMPGQSFNNLNVRLFEVANWPANLNIFGLGNNNLFARIVVKIRVFVGRLLGFSAQAAAGDVVPISVGVVSKDGTTHIFITPKDLLKKNTTYRVWINGDNNIADGSRRGALSQWGVPMNGDKTIDFTTLNQDYCKIEKVEVYANPPVATRGPITSDAFFCKGNECGKNTPDDDSDDDAAASWNTSSPFNDIVGNQHVYFAYAKDSSGTHTLNSNCSFQITGPDILSLAGDPASSWAQGPLGSSIGPINNAVFVNAYGDKTQNGQTAIKVVANGVYAGTGSAETTVSETVFICDNPWPSAANFPFRDKSLPAGSTNTNLETYYCRDKGEAGFQDDLPELKVIPIAGRDKIIKEFLLENKTGAQNIVKDQQGSNNLMINGIVPIVNDNGHLAAQFDGTDSNYLETNGNPFGNITGEITVSVLLKPTASPPTAGHNINIVSNYYNGSQESERRGWTLGSNEGTDFLAFTVDGDGGYYSRAKLEDFFKDPAAGGYLNQWVRVKAVFKPNAYIKIFINNQEKVVSTETFLPGTPVTVSDPAKTIPAIAYNPDTSTKVGIFGTGSAAFEGLIEELKIYNKDKSTNDSDDGLVSSYTFGDSADAAGIRVIRNNNHYSPLAWYNDAFPGSAGKPKGLTVDGYQAVSEGRTTYINGADLSDDKNSIYTDIYLVSYSQNASGDTKNIYQQLVDNFHLNAGSDTDGGLQEGFGSCSKDASKKCLSDIHCSKYNYGYCLSNKAKLTRDTKRVADIQDVNFSLTDYYNKKRCSNDQNRLCSDSSQCYGGAVCGNYYPYLPSGSYVANRSFSVWPSWQATLGNFLGRALPVDPLNKFEGCAGEYDPITCWNEKNKTMGCPALSYVYFYQPEKTASIITNKKDLLTHGEYDESGDKWSAGFNWSNVAMMGGSSTSHSNPFGWGGITVCGNNLNDDIDGDGHKNWEDVCPYNKTKWDDTNKGKCDCGIENIATQTCGAVTITNKEPDADCDGTPNCIDKCPNDPLKTAPGVCGCGVTEGDCEGGVCPNGVKEAGEFCDGTDGVATIPSDSSVSKQYACTNDCKFTGGWCGNKKAEGFYGEGCDDKDGTTANPGVSSVNLQYSCTADCRPAGGYCGDGILNGTEECDTNLSQPCIKRIIVTNNDPSDDVPPDTCLGMEISGTAGCNSDCTLSSTCDAIPSITGGTSTACSSTDVSLNYSCCELSSCAQDGCGCCGRDPLSGAYIDLSNKLVTMGYEVFADLLPCPTTPGYENSEGCSLGRSLTNPNDWYVVTNHTTANYKCWR